MLSKRSNRTADAVLKSTAPDDSFADFIVDQLQHLHDLDCRAMFGGHGLYQDEIFFAIVSKGRLYFKADGKSAARYHKRGMKPFRPNARQTLKTYYEVPADIIEDCDELAAWARQSIAVARDASQRRR